MNSLNIPDFTRECIEALPEAVRLRLLESKSLRRFRSKEILIREGAQPEGALIVLSGTIKARMTDSNGKVHLLEVFSSGSILCLHTVLRETRSEYTYVASDPGEVWVVPAPALRTLISGSSEFGSHVASYLSKLTAALNRRLIVRSTRSVRERIASALLLYADPERRCLLSRIDIAAWSGTSVENTIRTLSKMESEGLIRREGRVIHLRGVAELSALGG